jgi:hypothetical protein
VQQAHLLHWLSLFPSPSQVLVIKSEDYFAGRGKVLQQVGTPPPPDRSDRPMSGPSSAYVGPSSACITICRYIIKSEDYFAGRGKVLQVRTASAYIGASSTNAGATYLTMVMVMG